MSAAAWFIVVYVVLDRLLTVAITGRTFEVTAGAAVTSLMTGGVLIYCAIHLGLS